MEWFNRVDLTYRTELRELNEINFARFDAKLEQRIAQLDAKLEQRIAQLDAKLEQRTAELRAEMRVGFQALETKLIRWMFLFWIGQAVTTLGLVFGVVKTISK